MQKKILIVVGSTGGHYFPGIALGEKIKQFQPDIEIFFSGEKKISGLEIWRKKHFKFLPVAVVKRPRRKIFFPFIMISTIYVLIKCITLLKRLNPDLIVCMGSYVTVFPALAGLLIGKKVILHEQNLLPGLANKILNRFNIPAAITFKETKKYLKNTIHTGLPLRKELQSTEKNFSKYDLSSERKTILILGGSQGAKFINHLVIDTVNHLDNKKYQFIHITGRQTYEEVKQFYQKHNICCFVKDFSYEMPELMNLADIAIARAGAGTMAELSFKGIPAVFIPYRFGGGHQKYNAEWATKYGCVIMEEQNAGTQMLINCIKLLEQDLSERKKLFQSASLADTDGKLAKLCLQLIERNGKNN